MSQKNAATAKGLPLRERKARLAALVAKGVLSAKQAALIDLGEPSEKARAFGETLKGKANTFLTKKRRAAA